MATELLLRLSLPESSAALTRRVGALREGCGAAAPRDDDGVVETAAARDEVRVTADARDAEGDSEVPLEADAEGVAADAVDARDAEGDREVPLVADAEGVAAAAVGAASVVYPAPTILAHAGAKAAYQAAVEPEKLASVAWVRVLNGQVGVDTAPPPPPPPKRGQPDAGAMATSASERSRMVFGRLPPFSQMSEALLLAQGMPSICE